MERILPSILSILTDKPRVKPDIKWSSSLVYNIFRVYELLFWREGVLNSDGTVSMQIRPEMTTYCSNRGTTHYFHTLESFLVTLESKIFAFKIFPFKVYIPMLATPFGPIPSSPYLFAIAFGAASGAQNIGAVSTTSVAHTITGSNPLLVSGNHNAVNITTTSVKWNTTQTLVQVATVTQNTRNTDLYYLKAPTTGSFNVDWVIGAGVTTWSVVTGSYSGVDQSAPLNTSTTGVVVTTTMTLTVTTTVDNCWLIAQMATGGGSLTVGSGTTFRGTIKVNPDQTTLADSNGAKSPAGSYSLICTDAGGTGNSGGVMGAFKPAVASGNFLSFFK